MSGKPKAPRFWPKSSGHAKPSTNRNNVPPIQRHYTSVFYAQNGVGSIESCTFNLNRGGWSTVFVSQKRTRVSRSKFTMNSVGAAGSILTDYSSECEIVQCLFWNNYSDYAGYYVLFEGSVIRDINNFPLYVIASTFAKNTVTIPPSPYHYSDYGLMIKGSGFVVENCILWDNSYPSFSTNRLSCQVLSSCLPDANYFSGSGSINANPNFVDENGGDLRLQSGSPCIDAGNNYVDYYPSVPGFQLIDDMDLGGHWRIVDGNNDGTATVDMGAYEYQ